MYLYILYIYIEYVDYIYILYTLYILHKLPNGPEIGPAFSSVFMFMAMFVLVKSLVFATCLYHGDVFWHLISIGIYDKNIVLLQWEFKNAC